MPKKWVQPEYLITKDSYESHKDTFDVILNTTSTDLEVDSLVGMLKVGGNTHFCWSLWQ